MAVITISRTFASGGDEIARSIGHALGYPLFDKNLVIKAARDAGFTGKEITDLSEDTYKARSFIERLFGRAPMIPYMGMWPDDLVALYALEEQMLSEEDTLKLVEEAIRYAHQKGNIVILGRGGQILLKDQPDVFHVRIVAPLESRVSRLCQQTEQYEKPLQEDPADWARKLIQERDAASAEYIKYFYQADWADPLLYHLVLNTGKVNIEQAVQLIDTHYSACLEQIA
jgi:CMP/dCMP kinase